MDVHKIRSVVVDDSNRAVETICELLKSHSDVVILETFTDSESAFDFIARFQPELAFLDIEMPRKDGLSTIRELGEKKISTQFIMITAYEKYVLEALKLGVIDYLLKPVCPDELATSLAKFRAFLDRQKIISQINGLEANNHSGTIKVNTRTGFFLIKTEKILYCQADCNYTNIFLKDNRKVMASLNLAVIQAMINKTWFFRASRSVLINLNFFCGIDRRQKACYLLDGCREVKVNLPLDKLRDLEKLYV